MFIVSSRRPPARSVPYQRTHAMKGTLQDAIHGFYVTALARLPASELRSRFHRSLLAAGHCYAFDPVSNIIINTIWYDAVSSPPTVKLELDMVSTLNLTGSRTVPYGCLPLTDDDLKNYMDRQLPPDVSRSLGLMDNSIQGVRGVNSVEKAFLAAATAACHPKPEAQVKLFTLCMSLTENLASLLRGFDQISSEEVHLLAKLLSPESPSSKPQLRPFPFSEYLCGYNKIYKQVNAALEASIKIQVCKGFHKLFILTAPSRDEHGVSAIVTCKNVKNIRNKERVRCLYCDYNRIRIVHPVGTEFHGRKWDFEKMVCGEDPCDADFDPAFEEPYYTNMKIIDQSRITTERVNGRVKDDRLFDDCFGHESDQSDDYLNLSDADDNSSSLRDEYHVPAKGELTINAYADQFKSYANGLTDLGFRWPSQLSSSCSSEALQHPTATWPPSLRKGIISHLSMTPGGWSLLRPCQGGNYTCCCASFASPSGSCAPSNTLSIHLTE
ncbi:hypothetical protein PR202_gb00278 [Eleusine coracana subsp. coracana]|uniref:PIR2-like helical domain-containing protein n=1 Tax=Eleusine coracana subsp. coracana TaxID=191504 RepID=A0AAV5DT96_ELECO|nr:hypothetical protein PR202_gb00278 [Eleusine coracana subsp. coracana]